MTIQRDQIAARPSTPAADFEFDLDVSIVESGPVIDELMRLTDDGCWKNLRNRLPCHWLLSHLIPISVSPGSRMRPCRAGPQRWRCRSLYRFVDAAVVRVATLPSGVDLPPWPDLTGARSDHVARWRRWLAQVWKSEAIASAIEVASPVLSRRVQEICAGQRVREQEVRRVVLSVMRYLLRARSRATPFGLFAGIAPARVGPRSAARFGENHRTKARVDTEWLAGVITRLEAEPKLRHRLVVVANNLAFVRDGRLVVGCQQQPGAAGGTEPAEVSVRRTGAVRAIMQAAQAPVRLGDVAGQLAAVSPDTPESVIDGMLAELVRQRILVSSLRPSMTVTDPLAHVLKELVAAGADMVPGVAELLDELRKIHTELTRHDQAAPPTQGRGRRDAVSRKMEAIFSAERPVAVDLRLDCGVVLPASVAREAEVAAAALVRLTPNPFGSPAWQDYHGRFVERYGIGALVPVTELLNPDTGLGFPAGYRDSHLKHPPRPGPSERDVALLTLAQNAAMLQHTEIVLDEQMIAELAVEDIAEARVQPHTELRVRVHAPTLAALDHAEFELAVIGVSRAAGTTTGRFLDLFDIEDRERMCGAYTDLPTVSENALPVQVSCPALYSRAENVTRSPAVLPSLTCLGEYHSNGDSVIQLDDLAVSADARRLYLVSVSRRRPVEPVVFSAVEFINHAHPFLRFLCEISTARAPACAPFSWGAASRLPFLPRVRYRRTILSPARWMLAATDLSGPKTPWQSWAGSLTAWRRRFRVPGAVYLGADDRRIRLDLDEPAHLHLLRVELDRAGHAILRETPDAGAFGWINGRAHEIVIPLAATGRPVPQRAWPGRMIGREHGHLPAASDWLYVKLYGHPERQSAILTAHLPRLLSTWEGEPQWWFLRYHDPEPHLRLRIRLRTADELGPAAARIGAWAGGLRQRGLVGQLQWDTYFPETGRFGEAAAMTAAESVFATDSAAAITQLAATRHRSGPHRHTIVAASMVELAIAVTGGIGEGTRWLIEHTNTASTPAPARDVHDQAVRLGNPCDSWAALRAVKGGDPIVASWQRRRAALTSYCAAHGRDLSGHRTPVHSPGPRRRPELGHPEPGSIVSRPDPDAFAAASAIAGQLADPHAIPTTGVTGRSRAQSLAGGATGIALLHIERARTGHGAWRTVHAWLSAAVDEQLSAGPNASLFFGAPALAFVIHAAADQPGKYERAIAALDGSTATLTRQRLDDAHARIDRGERPALAEFDLIRGLAGLGAYHLHRHPHHDITRAVLSYLVRLTEPLPGRTEGLPGWWSDLAPHGAPSPEFPGGHGNFGMSHGIAASLALLSIALRRGVSVEGHTEAINRICAWLDAYRQEHPAGPWWPGFIALDQIHHDNHPGHPRPSWCYGTPGLARAHQLAGLATGDTARQRTAETAMLRCLRDRAQLDRITDSGLCHGTAGVLQTAWRMAADARSPDIATELPHLSARLLTQLRSAPRETEFLDGTAGAALALHTAGTGVAPLTSWDACLLLA